MRMLECCKRFWLKCLAADAPVFTVVAWDKLAPSTVAKWIADAKEAGVNPGKIRRAHEHLTAIEAWQTANPDRVKVPD